jgi:hypothetical protein
MDKEKWIIYLLLFFIACNSNRKVAAFFGMLGILIHLQGVSPCTRRVGRKC